MTMKTAGKANPNIGSDFDEFLREAGIYEHAQAVAVKRNLQKAQLAKTDAERGTSRTRAQLGCSHESGKS